MSGNHDVVPVEQDWVRESKLLDAIADLADLAFRVGARIAGIVLNFADFLVRDQQL